MATELQAAAEEAIRHDIARLRALADTLTGIAATLR